MRPSIIEDFVEDPSLLFKLLEDHELTELLNDADPHAVVGLRSTAGRMSLFNLEQAAAQAQDLTGDMNQMIDYTVSRR